ncbi:MAG: AsnC family transcriptional regulator [Gammaproteobacteria bacterium]|nr:AsnC family transcriptional regulator [Gammaproteobacteria bacterium]
MPYQPDRIDFKILSEQQADGRLTIVELARRISLTKTLPVPKIARSFSVHSVWIGLNQLLNTRLFQHPLVNFVIIVVPCGNRLP